MHRYVFACCKTHLLVVLYHGDGQVAIGFLHRIVYKDEKKEVSEAIIEEEELYGCFEKR